MMLTERNHSRETVVFIFFMWILSSNKNSYPTAKNFHGVSCFKLSVLLKWSLNGVPIDKPENILYNFLFLFKYHVRSRFAHGLKSVETTVIPRSSFSGVSLYE